jgi:pimeloyl-ACP methyl ester carboxylesterase
VLAMTGSEISDGIRAQHALQLKDFPDRLADYTRISVPSLVIGFADDLMVPTVLSKEVADAIPGARYVEIPDCGHFGYLERPDEVNAAIIDFLARTEGGAR